MRIIELEAENVKRLKAVRIRPGNEPIVVIKGVNGAGKSSTLDCIAYGLGGKSLFPDKPVRDGQKKARIKITLGNEEAELTVTRRWGKSGATTTLEVIAADGTKQAAPQRLLDGLFAKVTFDPLDFIRVEPKKQAILLRELVGLDVSKEENARAGFYSERTEVNRKLKSVEGQLDGFADLPADIPDKEVSAKDLTARLQGLLGLKAKRDSLISVRAKIAGLMDEIKKLEDEEKRITEEGQKLAEKLDKPKNVDEAVQKTQEEMGSIAETNALVGKKRQRDELEGSRETYQGLSDELTKSIETCEERKKQKLAEAKFPVDGLTIGPVDDDEDDHVLLNGVPLQQASSAEQLRVSVNVGLAMNPKLKVLLVREGSLLDEDSMALLDECAERMGGQVWVERVGRGGMPGILIEDGEVVEVEGLKEAMEELPKPDEETQEKMREARVEAGLEDEKEPEEAEAAEELW